MKEKAAIEEVDAQCPNGLLLQQDVGLMKPGVHDHLARLFVWGSLKLEPKPSVALNGLVIVDGGYSIGEGEKMFGRMLIWLQSRFHEIILMIQHFLHTAFADISTMFFNAVNGIGKILVVSRDRFRNGA